jgi:UDP-glucose 4-epimerase
MKVLITGGAGFIGSHLTDTLLNSGYEVTVMDDLSTGRLANLEHARSLPNFHLEIDTILNEAVLERLMGKCDIVYHLASAVGVRYIVDHPVEAVERNVLGTQTVLKIASHYRKKVLLTSSSEIYGKNGHAPFSEDDDRVLGSTTKTRWSYSDSKAIAEYLALAYYREKNLPIVIARLFNTIGPRQTGQYGMVVPRLIQQVINNKPMTVYGDGSQTRCFCYVTDVVRALIGLMNSEESIGEIYNVGNRDEISIMELAHLIKNIAQSNSRIITVPYDAAYEEGFEDMRRRIPNINKIGRYIGWKPTINLEEMLHLIIQDFLGRKTEMDEILSDRNEPLTGESDG